MVFGHILRAWFVIKRVFMAIALMIIPRRLKMSWHARKDLHAVHTPSQGFFDNFRQDFLKKWH